MHSKFIDLESQLYAGTIDIDFFASELPSEEVVALMLQMVEKLDEDWVKALLFVKDACLAVYGRREAQQYLKALDKHDYLTHFEKWSRSIPSDRCCQVIHVLGKLNQKRHVALLDRAFATWMERDPFIIDALLFELSWLKDKNINVRLQRVQNCENYIFRWFLLDTCFVDLELASQDSHPRIRADASLLLRDRNAWTEISKVKQSFYSLGFDEFDASLFTDHVEKHYPLDDG